jgi:hypothetical protein
VIPISIMYASTFSWDEVAKYVAASPEATRITAGLIERYPDGFLFGTDAVAPTSQSEYEGLQPVSAAP